MRMLAKKETIRNGVIDAAKKILKEPYTVHQHDFFEIEYILSGSGDYQVNGRHYPIVPGQLFFLTPADFHAVETDFTELITIMFSPHQGNRDPLFRLTVGRKSPEIALKEGDGALILLLISEILSRHSRRDTDGSMRFLDCLLLKMSETASVANGEETSYLKETILYLLEHFCEDVTLERTARHVGLSPNYLSELFHDGMGMGWKTYLDSLRLDYVANLLRFSDLSATRVGEAVGFSDYANFSRRFKKRYGMSPSAYRRLEKSLL